MVKPRVKLITSVEASQKASLFTGYSESICFVHELIYSVFGRYYVILYLMPARGTYKKETERSELSNTLKGYRHRYR
jgi:hypothetical protein